jgi:hypothetical protein
MKPSVPLSLLLAIAPAAAMANAGAPGAGHAAVLQRAEQCELAAVSAALQWSRSAGADDRILDALRVAAGTCTRFVLALVAEHEVPRVCASLDHWSAAHTARELRRRIAAIESDRLLSSTGVGRSCRSAYLHELKTTRVVLRSMRR